MKMIKINGQDLVMKFSTKVINLMNLEGISLKTITEDLKTNFDTTKLNKAFYYSLITMQKDITEERAYELLDLWIDEGKDGESIQYEVIGELMTAMGFKKQFKQMTKEQEQKAKK